MHTTRRLCDGVDNENRWRSGKQLFNATNISVTEYKFGEHFDKKAFYEEFGEGATFPQVQIDNTPIGGCKETLQFLQKKKLI